MSRQPSCSSPRRGNLEDVLRPELFKAMAEPVRVSLIAVLAEAGEPQTVGQLAARCDIDPSGVSRHLKILREADLVEANRAGREVRYSLRMRALTKELRALADGLERCCP
jgi:DNA-binding transcriptional ArsR family regulator